jgi:anthranilate phosphoribosyltransferase
MKWDQIFAALADKKDLSNEQVTWGMSQILEGAASNEDINYFLSWTRIYRKTK